MLKTPQDIISERICRRLADLAHEMAHDRLGCWKDLRKDLLALKPEDFQVRLDFRDTPKNKNLMREIEIAVNRGTHRQVRQTQGSFSFGRGYLEMFENHLTVISFAPGHCRSQKARYAALMTVERFKSIVSCPPRGRLLFAGQSFGAYGFFQTTDFDTFAYSLNWALGRHALPETIFMTVDFKKPVKGPKPQP